MTPGEYNADIWATFENDDHLTQEPELKQVLGKYSLVQPRGTALLHDASELFDTYSQEVFPADCG